MVVLARSSSALVELALDTVARTGWWMRVIVHDLAPERGPLHESQREEAPPADRPLAAGGHNRLLSVREIAESGPTHPLPAKLPGHLLRYGVVYPGGQAATNLGTLKWPTDYVVGVGPLFDCRPGSGSVTQYEERLWLSPPPDGSLRCVVEWPGEGISETWTDVDWPPSAGS